MFSTSNCIVLVNGLINHNDKIIILMNTTCNKCSALGLSFYSEHIQPPDYIEGRKSADIWIIGLNPKGNLGHVEQRTINDFENFDPDCHSYFRDFKKVSPMLYKNWKSQNSRVAHTDLVKCFSQSFPLKQLQTLHQRL